MKLRKRLRLQWRYRRQRFQCVNCRQVGGFRWHMKHKNECVPLDRAARRREMRACPLCKAGRKHQHAG